MRPVNDSRRVTCPYGKKGSSWSTGEHGGLDYGCPTGDPVYAMWGGKITGTSWGSAYGTHVVIDHDRLPDGSPGLWAVYAHLSRVDVKAGQRVEAGQRLGSSGATGNASGPHLHVEVQRDARWKKGNYTDPQPWIDAGGKSSPAASDGPHVTKDIYTDRLGYGQDDSDTVKELQERLNRIKLEGGKNLPVTGNYAEQTDAEVRKWQEQKCGDKPDPAGRSYLGPRQVAKMFPADVYTIHDKGLPDIASSSSPPSGADTALGTWLADLGFAVEDGDDVPLGRDATWDRVRFIVIHHTASDCDGSEADIAAYVRTGGEYPPLAQITLGQSGTVWMCSRERAGQSIPGRASHAGKGSGFGIPDDTLNEVGLGIECQCDGSHPLSTHPVLYSTLIRLVAALCHRFDVPPERVIGHREWAPDRKQDPRDDMAVIRADVAARLSEPPPAPDDELENPPEQPGIDTSEAGLWKWYSDKPKGEVKVYPDGDWHRLAGLDEPASGIKGGSEKRMLYLRLEFTKTRKSDRVVEVKFVRANGDATAYDSETYGLVKDSYPMPIVHFEDGDGAGGKWWVKVTGGKDPMTITTRYAKQHTTIAKEL